MLRPRSKAERKKLEQLIVSTFELNYPHILSFLEWTQQRSVKLICRGIYYISITSQIWTGMRLEVLDKKMELFDDLDFLQQQPKVVSKQEKQIRIHSLKKNTGGVKLRQASNIKQKKVAINTINQQLPFRNTQIGFKRLLKSNISIKPAILSTKEVPTTLMDLVEIPKQWTVYDLVVDVKDPWSKNVHRVNNLCTIVKKWNEFHHRITAQMKQTENDLSGLIKKCIRIDGHLTSYFKAFQTEPYQSVKQSLAGAQQQLLIDQQLNKIGKIFIYNHAQLTLISQNMQKFISTTHQSCSKLGKLKTQGESTWIVDGFSILEELAQNWAKINNQCPDLLRILSKSLLQIVDSLLQSFSSTQLEIAGDSTTLFGINTSHLSKRPDFFEVLFQSYENVATSLVKICEIGEQENMGLKLSVAKFKNLKVISHHLWSISKYFTKLVKQLQAKEKKGASGNKSQLIKTFMQSYENLTSSYNLLDWKNPTRSEKEVAQLKQNVAKLKSQMQTE